MPVAEKFTVLLPPVAEQRRIAVILDKADTIRRKREEGIRLTEELLRSTFLEITPNGSLPQRMPASSTPQLIPSFIEFFRSHSSLNSLGVL